VRSPTARGVIAWGFVAGMTTMRRPSLFKESDVRRAAKAVLSAGLGIARIEIDKAGVIVVVPSKPEERLTTEAVSNEWDDVVA
jgi:hypothetical protein